MNGKVKGRKIKVGKQKEGKIKSFEKRYKLKEAREERDEKFVGHGRVTCNQTYLIWYN